MTKTEKALKKFVAESTPKIPDKELENIELK